MSRLFLCGVLLVGWVASSAHPQADEDVEKQTSEAAVWLLQRATLVHRNGFHNVLLRALRQMSDPRLEPMFSELVQRRHPGLKIHGILGLAEISDPPKLDLALVADIKSAATQAQLISAAIDSDLLNTDAAKQLASWPTLDPAVRVLVTSQLVADKNKVDPVLLDKALASDNPALKGMAALLKAQQGDAEALKTLEKIDQEAGPQRDSVRGLLLQTAMRYEFAVAADWAGKMLKEAELDRDIAYQALRTTLMFGQEGAVNAWMHRFDSAKREAERLRLAVLALDIADRVDPRLFKPMLDHEDALIKQVGVVGTELANKKAGTQQIIKLLRMNNLLTSRWTVQYAIELSEKKPEQARPLLIAIIESADDEKMIEPGVDRRPRFAAQRLEHAVAAVQKLHEHDKQGATLLASMIRKAPILVQEAMVMGLIRSKGERPDRIIEGIDEFKSKTSQSMAVLLRAKHLEKLDGGKAAGPQRRALSLIVRGGAGLRDPLRIQAAWTYLKLTGQDNIALARVLGEDLARP